MDHIWKDFINIFKNESFLNIVWATNFKIINFLDVSLNLSNCKYHPYSKPGNTSLYIDINSNRPPNIAKNLSETIFRRVTKLSSAKVLCDHSKDFYNGAFSNS